MSKKERIASSLDRITDLCFTISELAIGEDSEEEASAKASTSALCPEAAIFEPSRKGKEKISGKEESAIFEDWESVPDLPSESDTPPSYCQVVGGSSQSVCITPVGREVRSQSVDSGESSAMAANLPNFAAMTVAQFDQYYNGLQTDPARIAAETQALTHGSDAIRISVLLKRDNRNHANLTAMQGQLQQAQATAAQAQQQAQVAAAAQAAAVAAAAGQYATLQWPMIEERLKRKPAQSTKSVAGKRKASGSGSGRTSKARLSAALTDEQYAHNMANRLCRNCGKPDHIAADCTEESQNGSNNRKKQKKGRKDFQKR
ncbi:hypothetical protein KFL_014020020 [Klebsormidium nitens]|uniref:CCHC-type domain-containing protein n=1 Tax=Klebsormidium nitens TaxID=105231 RepID=A0A1Y1IQS6_KLENI|nr:hypothetical protein KFL_014020020 [Klebsormidium nitens]|eukprot:GAQ93265.1 hypothetical protein KFL_014020020 [Klebsormidium nitens]